MISMSIQMNRQSPTAYTGLIILMLLFYSSVAQALKVKPGVGAGAEYTDNVRLTPNNKKADTIAVGYVGLDIKQNEGPLLADVMTSLNKYVYTQDSYADQRYFNLNGNMDWEAVKNQFHLIMRDNYYQTPVTSVNSNRPGNIQDTNIFNFGANWAIPVSEKWSITLVPEYSKYYYELLKTDNKQYALNASLLYRMYRLTNVGFNASVRKIDYDIPIISDTTFSTLQLTVSGNRARSNYSLSAGTTSVKRGSQSYTGFSGSLLWLTNLTGHSDLTVNLSTDLTDSSSGQLNTIINADNGNGNFNNVQITTDVIRNKLARLAYNREDGTFNSSLWTEYQEIIYSDSPNDRSISALGINLNYPVTALLSSGFYTYYGKTRLTELARDDNNFSVGFNLSYQHSRKLRSTLDIKYRKKQSTRFTQNYQENTIFYNLVYGFGSVLRPTRTGSVY